MMFLKSLFFCILFAALIVYGESKTEKAYEILSEDIWITHHNKKFQVSDFKNRWLLMTIVYSDCDSICPMNVKFIKKFEKQLLDAGANPEAFQIVLVSIKSKDETPETMSKFLSNSGVGNKNWVYIKSHEDQTRKLVAEVDMSFGKNIGASRHIMHSSKVALISPKGTLTDVLMTGELDQKTVELVLKRFGEIR